MSRPLLEANLAALEARSAGLAAAVRAAAASPDLRVERARSGDPVPVVRSGDRDWFLHSRYDPRSEAARAAAALPRPSHVVALGIGAAYHLRALLAFPDWAGVVGFDRLAAHRGPRVAGSARHDVIGDPRVQVVAGASPDEVARLLLAGHQPAVCGPLVTLPLEPRVRTAAAYFAAVAAAVSAAARRAADDLAVQARFGRRWFANILANLEAMARGAQWPSIGPRVAVAAAGPSLLSLVDDLAAGTFLIATDTALPALAQSGIAADLVLSIDCQNVSYHHFLGGLPARTRLALDAGSPPLLARMAGRPLFLASPHPLAALIARTLVPLAPLDTSGGNVTHAAVSLAFTLGAREVEVVGADLSYPGGSPYARGTYFFPYFQSRATRLRPADSELAGFVFADADLPPSRGCQGARYRSRRLEGYREGLRRSFAPAAETGPGRLLFRRPGERSLPRSGAASGDWRCWLAGYGGALRALRPPAPPLWRSWLALAPEERDVWTTLLPAAAAMPAGPPHERLERARAWCSRRVEERLQA